MLTPEHDGRRVVGRLSLRVMLAMTLAPAVIPANAGSVGRVGADPAVAPVFQQDALQDAVSRAGRNVEEAWEAFHRAALGGTLASPAIQAKIERALHEARRLLAAARAAAQINDHRAVSTFARRIEDLSARIQHDSRMRKP
ncbi:MAG: hypothetical protein OXR07_02885 [Nitrospira sp.]|nr:hypothetical protein [Nitrospira sp.]